MLTAPAQFARDLGHLQMFISCDTLTVIGLNARIESGTRYMAKCPSTAAKITPPTLRVMLRLGAEIGLGAIGLVGLSMCAANGC